VAETPRAGSEISTPYYDGGRSASVRPSRPGALLELGAYVGLSCITASFTGVGYDMSFAVSDLAARTDCRGQRIQLTWTNPTGTLRTKIVRRARSWPFDLTDDHDVIYDGVAITSFDDSGHTTTDANKTLEPQTYYYYLVLASDVPLPVYWDLIDASRTFGLSIAIMDSKNKFFWKNTPREAKRLDDLSKSEGGGGGDLDKWFTIMGCWLNLMRGHANALQLASDDDASPYPLLKHKNISLGTESEGDSYDWATARRQALSQHYVYARRGSCAGIIEAVRMFTLWDCTCAEMGLASGCNEGATGLKTWDGFSSALPVSPSLVSITQTVLSEDGDATIAVTDPLVCQEADAWAGGKLVGLAGDVVCIAGNTGNSPYHVLTPLTVTTVAPDALTYANVAVAAGTVSLSVASTNGIFPGLSLQLSGKLGAAYKAEIVTVTTVAPPNTVNLLTAVVNTYDNFPKVSIGKGILRFQDSFTAACVQNNATITVAGAMWVENQWKGAYIRVFGFVETVVSNTTNTITMGSVFTPASGSYTAYITNIDAGTSELKYLVGAHSELFEPLKDLEAHGSIYDTSSRLWAGTAVSSGVWGPNDVGVYITTPGVLKTWGKPSGGSGAVVLLDPSSAVPAVNEYVGMWLNPNQNQSQTFEIIANDAVSITVDGNIGSLINTTQYYWVMETRNRNRFTRISKRLNKEFAHQDITTRVLFV
jgi:hypothetical protein